MRAAGAKQDLESAGQTLEAGLEDAAYLALLADRLPGLLEQVRPDLVFFNAGVDPHAVEAVGDLDPALLGRVEELIDFVTSPDT